MTKPVLRIERVNPRPGKRDEAFKSRGYYTLGDPSVTSKQRKTSAYSKKLRDLDEVAYWIENHGWHIRMGETWRDASLIEPAMVRVIR